jgi:glucans biosynthesis protein
MRYKTQAAMPFAGSMNRRTFLAALLASASGAGGLASRSLMAAENALRFGPARPFSKDALRARAKRMASQPFVPPATPDRQILERIDYDEHGRLRFDPAAALFSNGPGRYPVTFFHLGRYFQVPVRMHAISQGRAHEILYDPGLFNMSPNSPARALGAHTGYAGFRLQESRLGDQTSLDWQRNDWVAFLGASYFRAIGDAFQYGLSARGIAIDVALADRPEEFPSFTEFFIETPGEDDQAQIVHALLDGPSICGAYSFRLVRGTGVTMTVDASIFLRRPVQRLGIAPLTSMYWYSEKSRQDGIDWRPEVHDSDGLAIWNGHGERIWRPLNNPQKISASAFRDNSPKGFGLLQRDRDFDHYLDGVHYERRPGLWVEPLGNWGEGAIQLIEIPTTNETHDNIVAMWVPASQPLPGRGLDVRYRLHWQAEEPNPVQVARCVATRIGRGGEPGQLAPGHTTKFVVEFLGEPLSRLPYGVVPEVMVSCSQGRVLSRVAEAVPNGRTGHWRVRFDLTAQHTGPIELRLYLRHEGQALTETWLYQFQSNALNNG